MGVPVESRSAGSGTKTTVAVEVPNGASSELPAKYWAASWSVNADETLSIFDAAGTEVATYARGCWIRAYMANTLA